MGREQKNYYEYLAEEFSIGVNLGISPMKGRQRFDDDFRGLPRVKGGKKNRNDSELRFFRASIGDRIITNLAKERPDLGPLLKALEIGEGELVVNLESGDGVVGCMIADKYPDNQVILIDSSLTEIPIARRNTVVNSLVNAEVIPGIGIQSLESSAFPDVVVYTPNRFTGYDLVQEQLFEIAKRLKIGSRLYILSHKKGGVNRHIALAEEYFGEKNVGIVARGAGGVRVIEVVKNEEIQAESYATYSPIEAEILGRILRVETSASLFSKEGFDKGTRFLLETIDLTEGKEILDVGSGWGAIGLTAATVNPQARVTMFDVNLRAVEAAARNITNLGLEDRVQVIGTADPINDIPGSYDVVLSNPPFHQSNAILNQLFVGVRDKTAKDGKIYLVIEKSYAPKFSDILNNVMGNSHTVADNGRYVILTARK